MTRVYYRALRRVERRARRYSATQCPEHRAALVEACRLASTLAMLVGAP